MSVFEAIFLGILTFFNLTIYMLAGMTSAILAHGRLEEDGLADHDSWVEEDDIDEDHEAYDDAGHQDHED